MNRKLRLKLRKVFRVIKEIIWILIIIITTWLWATMIIGMTGRFMQALY